MEVLSDILVRKIFDKPKVIVISADVNSGKSMLIYDLIDKLLPLGATIKTFGLRVEIPKTTTFNSVQELEEIRNSIVFVDEFYNLFNLDDRRQAVLIERTLRLICHNNNILVLAGTGDNFKKFISNKADVLFYKKNTIGNFINGSSIKYKCMDYKGYELGTTILNIPIGQVLIFDGKYTLVEAPYNKKYDTKLKNEPLLKKVHQNVHKIVGKNNVKNNVQENNTSFTDISKLEVKE